MDIIIETGFEAVEYDVKWQPETPRKGQELVAAGHVRNVREHRKNGVSYKITCSVIRMTS